ncbi:hypothetical protein [Paenibacillus pini]|uniref:Uncharacterized protein n=1 Tax=Paenibacillus pini JCM 16418 TaxID=1236976 RepID=W7YIX8_9BACL|nr:hypothetical protein [Paenibacillus pini]GAF10855.1 hypothetical protein JCM16418_5082 [Paenibacillus pini JCM 16418]
MKKVWLTNFMINEEIIHLITEDKPLQRDIIGLLKVNLGERGIMGTLKVIDSEKEKDEQYYEIAVGDLIVKANVLYMEVTRINWPIKE